MKTDNLRNIFICDSFDRVSGSIKLSKPGKIFYVRLDPGFSYGATELLNSFKARDLTKKVFSDLSGFKREYCGFMRDLNRRNSSIRWWAMNFTNKNPLLTDLYNDSFYAAQLAKLAQDLDFECLFIYSSNIKLARKLKSLENELNAAVYDLISRKISLKDILKERSPLFVVYAAAKALFRKFISSIRRGNFTGNASGERLYLIVTPFDGRIFEGRKFEDAYFKSLAGFLSENNIKTITAGLVSCCSMRLLFNKEPDAFPLEKYLKMSDIFRALTESIRIFLFGFRFKEGSRVAGMDASDLVKSEIKLSVNSGQLFLNMAVYFSCLNLIKRFVPDKVLYPFENRSWEKMIILASRAASKSVRLAGYQHASLTPKHTNLCLEKGEYLEIPFPDEIITMGRITKDAMVDTFNFPEDRLKVGCALRQSLARRGAKSEPLNKLRSILIPLASGVDEYVRMLEFLDAAFMGSGPYTLIIRPHPLIDFEKAVKRYGPKNIKYELDKAPLCESLKRSDLVIYASSTVALEAISMGIPVISAALDDVLNPDPLFNMQTLRWVCEDPGSLKNMIETIENMDKDVFSDLQEKAAEYGRLYCVPVNRDSMKAFI